MSFIDELRAQVQPAMDAVRANPDVNPNFVVMRLLVDKMTDESSPTWIKRALAAQLVMGMKIEVSDPDDAEKAADFLFQGYEMVAIMTEKLAGYLDEATLIAGCRVLSIEC